MSFAQTLDSLLAGEHLGADAARRMMDEILEGELGPERLAALMTALRAKGGHVDELVGFARSMRQHAHPIKAPEGIVLDNCGTGGASTKTFNISTAASFVLAGAGITVAKHGNRSVTRPSGSADVLETAGARLNLSPQQCQAVLHKTGIAFLFAPTFHPSMRHAVPVRQALGIKTIFNLLGPLTNPAGATHQVLGVYDQGLVFPIAEALTRLGCQGGFVLHGEPGTDEATPCGQVHAVQIIDGRIKMLDPIRPEGVGIQTCEPHAIRPVAREDAPALLQQILSGKGDQAHSDAVAFNVAFGLVATGKAPDLKAGVEQARELIQSGAGMAKWDAFIAATKEV